MAMAMAMIWYVKAIGHGGFRVAKGEGVVMVTILQKKQSQNHVEGLEKEKR